MNRKAAEAALAAYVGNCGPGEAKEPEHWQASDLVTDLLMLFDADTARKILRRVEGDLTAEQPDVTPVLPAAI
ncbi:hypothetical protein [Streptomyces tirandamycinicus]|uniref:Uncharacterized protein n=1 Tax=Streptomyces tirandamycinicus TaxID=2174846 RepID=A0A2S1T292_9ACTN|nr:hypothetical protein [Streptomyces tirandamycinicus]AWI32637.1 hypothetical protein DDW44_30425 [Streptomyces tirandamycinicus]